MTSLFLLTSEDNMHFVIIGSGAVGGYFGARLAQANNKVSFIARGKHLLAMQKDGLTVDSINGNFHLKKLNVYGNTQMIKNVNVIILAVKTFQLESVIPLIQPLINESIRIIPLLNGINAAERLIKLGIPATNIYGGLAKIISKVVSPGVIQHSGAKPHITLGLLVASSLKTQNEQSKENERLIKISEIFTQANISVGVTQNIRLALWRKFIFVAAWGALAAVENKTVGCLRSNACTRKKLHQIVHEYAAIANAQNVAVTEKVINETLMFIDALPDHSKTSMQRDISHKCQSEFSELVQLPYQLSKQHKLPSPVLAECYKSTLIKTKKYHCISDQ